MLDIEYSLTKLAKRFNDGAKATRANRLYSLCASASGYWRVVGEVEELIDKAKELSQRSLFGIGLARILNKG